MVSKQFLQNFNEKVTIEGQNLIAEFFITFSRFECALKISNFTNANEDGYQDKVTANWDRFTNSIQCVFTPNKNINLQNAVDYLKQNPPKVQNIINGRLGWRNRIFQVNEPEIIILSQHIRDIRNNLFHGGKFNGIYEEDVSRNFMLLKHSLTILNEWLELSQDVRRNFLAPL